MLKISHTLAGGEPILMQNKTRFTSLAISLFLLQGSYAQAQQGDAQADTDLTSFQWIHGAKDCEIARAETGYVQWQEMRYQSNTIIFRQNKCSNYEAPFVYLFIGNERSLLIDTGATEEGGASLLAAVREITDLPLIVAHTHGHGDHTKGDDAFSDQEDTSVVGEGAEAVESFFGFENWPEEQAELDLGGRTISLLPVPGHTDDDLVFYDPVSQFAVTGDTLYPGRLYVRNWSAYRASIARLNAWIQEKPVSHVLGTHIEMSAETNVDYPIGTTYQPDERKLALAPSDIFKLHETLMSLEAPERTYLGSFIIWPVD